MLTIVQNNISQTCKIKGRKEYILTLNLFFPFISPIIIIFLYGKNYYEQEKKQPRCFCHM